MKIITEALKANEFAQGLPLQIRIDAEQNSTRYTATLRTLWLNDRIDWHGTPLSVRGIESMDYKQLVKYVNKFANSPEVLGFRFYGCTKPVGTRISDFALPHLTTRFVNNLAKEWEVSA